MGLCLVRGYEHVLIAGEEQSDNQNKLRAGADPKPYTVWGKFILYETM